MLYRLTRGDVSSQSARVTDGPAPNGLRVNDISDAAVALAWTPVAGALTYTAYRARGRSELYGNRHGRRPSFSDAGLRPATSYVYKLTANTGGRERPASTVATALPVPPCCPTPGGCPVAR